MYMYHLHTLIKISYVYTYIHLTRQGNTIEAIFFFIADVHVADWSWVLDIINAKKSALSSVSIVRVRIPSKVPLLKLFFCGGGWVVLGHVGGWT
jgi:hypothetical protein